MQPDGRLPDILAQQLKRLRQRLIGVSLAEGLGLTLLITSIAIGIILSIDLFVDLPLALRVGMLSAVPVIAGLVIVWKGILPAARRYRPSELAAVVEVAHPELRERLLSVVELADAPEENSGSPVMRQWLLQQTVEFAETHDFADVVDARRAIRHCWLGAVAFLALLLPLVFATQAYATLLSRFFNPWGNNERLQNLVLTIDQPDRTVGRGDDVEIVARPTWRFHAGEFPAFAQLNWTQVSGTQADNVRQSRRMDWNDETQTYSVLLSRVIAGFHYDVSAAQSRTPRHRIDVADRPGITQFTVDLVPPAYTGEPAEHYDSLPGEILAVEQSRLELQLAFDKPVKSAEVLWLDGSAPRLQEASRIEETVNGAPVRFRTPLPLSDDGQSVRWSLTAALDQPSGRFLIRVRDEHQLTSRQEPIRRLTIQPDTAPHIEFADQDQTPEARPNDILHIPVSASDDYGLAAVELHCEWTLNSIRESKVIPIPADQLGARSVRHEFQLDLTPFSLTPGTPFTIRARATDERPVPAPNESWTHIRQLQIRVDAKAAGDQALADRQHRTNQAIDQLQSDIDKQKQAARRLQNQAQSDAARQTEWQRDAETAELEEQIRKLSEQIEQLGAVMEQQPVFQHLAERARQIAERSLAASASKVNEAQQADLSRKQQLLNEAANHLQKAGQELDSLQEEFEKLSQMQRDLLELNRIADQVEKLANDVDGLTARQVLNPTNVLARQQWQQDHRQLVTQHRTLEGDLDSLLEKHPGLMDKAREVLQHRMVALSEQAERLAKQQQSLLDTSSRTPPPKQDEASAPSAEEQRQQQRLAAALDHQGELLERSRALSADLRQLGLKDSLINKRAPAFSDAARQATESLRQLKFPQAAEQAATASERARLLAEELRNPDGPSVPERLQQQALEAAEVQQQLADSLQKLAGSPQAQQAFREHLQNQSLKQTETLTEELKQRGADFKLDRIDRAAQGELAQQAGQQSAQAEGALKQSAEHQQQAEQEAATESAKQGIESLRRAAHLARQASEGANPKRPPETDIPGEVGRQVAESSQRLGQAGELLSQLQELAAQRPGTEESNTRPEVRPAPGEKEGEGEKSNPPSDEKDSAQKPGTGEPKADSRSQDNSSPMSMESSSDQNAPQNGAKPAKTDAEVTSLTLREAAQGLRLAAEQMGLARNQNQDPGPQQQSGQESQQSSSNDAGNSANTAETHLQMLENSLGRVSEREWGKLPGKLQTEMLESSQRQRDPTYRSLIRRYFEDISKAREPELKPDGPSGR